MIQCKTRRVLALLLVFVCSTIVAPTVMAQEDHPGWTIDIARQLLAEGWEDPEPIIEGSVVGYAVHFVELDRDFATRLGFGFDLDTGEHGPGLWGISENDFQLQVLLDTRFHFAPNLHYEVGYANQSTSYDSWLFTMIGKPIRVEVSNSRIPKCSTGHQEERLEIKILPKKVDGERGQVESEVSFFYETLGGTFAQLQTTASVSAVSDRPIAVVSRETKVGRTTEYQYFAVYVAGTVIPNEHIPKDSPFIPMGTVAGVQEILAEPAERSLVEIGLGGSFAGGSWGFAVDGMAPIGTVIKVYGHMASLPEFTYAVGIEGSINTEFSLVAEVGGTGVPRLRLGVRDDLHLGENLIVSATILPIQFTLGGNGKTLAFNWRVQVEYLKADYGLWYQVNNDLGQVGHSAGTSLFRSKPAEARLAWSWDDEHGSVLTAGIWLKF